MIVLGVGMRDAAVCSSVSAGKQIVLGRCYQSAQVSLGQCAFLILSQTGLLGRVGVHLRSRFPSKTYTTLCHSAHRLIPPPPYPTVVPAVLQPAPNQLVQNLPEGMRVPFARHRPSNIPSPPPLIPTSKPSDKPTFIQGGSILQVSQIMAIIIKLSLKKHHFPPSVYHCARIFFFFFFLPVCFCSCREHQARICPHTLMPCMGQRELRALEDPSLSVCQDSRTLPSLVKSQGRREGWRKHGRDLKKSLCPEYLVSENSLVLYGSVLKNH